MICPKCGFEQPEGEECLRCGIVFRKVRRAAPGSEAAAPPSAPPPEPTPPPISPTPARSSPTLRAAPPEPSPSAVGAPAVTPAMRSDRPLGVLEVISASLRIYFANLVAFVAISLVALAPLLAATFFLAAGLGSMVGGGAEPGLLGVAVLGMVVLALLGYGLLNAAVTHGVSRYFRDRPVQVGGSLRVGVAMMLTAIAVGFLQGLATLAGLLLLIIPGLMVMTALWVAVPIAVVERREVLDALSRSAELTRGYRWPVFGVLSVYFLLVTGFDLALGRIFGQMPGFALLSAISDLVQGGWGATLATVLYYQLRRVRDGIDSAELAAVFD